MFTIMPRAVSARCCYDIAAIRLRYRQYYYVTYAEWSAIRADAELLFSMLISRHRCDDVCFCHYLRFDIFAPSRFACC